MLYDPALAGFGRGRELRVWGKREVTKVGQDSEPKREQNALGGVSRGQNGDGRNQNDSPLRKEKNWPIGGGNESGRSRMKNRLRRNGRQGV